MQPYMSGLMLGASIGKAMHNMLFQKQAMGPAVRGGRPSIKKAPAACHEARPETTEYALVSASKGRRRYSVSSLQNNEELAGLLEEKLAKLDYIKSVKANSVTGSLLLVFQCNPARIEFLMYRLFGNKAEKPKHHGKKRAAVGNSLCGSVRAMDKTLIKNTANWLDLSTIISLFFILRGLRKMILFGQSPSGPQMLWWAFTLMRGRRTE